MLQIPVLLGSQEGNCPVPHPHPMHRDYQLSHHGCYQALSSRSSNFHDLYGPSNLYRCCIPEYDLNRNYPLLHCCISMYCYILCCSQMNIYKFRSTGYWLWSCSLLHCYLHHCIILFHRHQIPLWYCYLPYYITILFSISFSPYSI